MNHDVLNWTSNATILILDFDINALADQLLVLAAQKFTHGDDGIS